MWNLHHEYVIKVGKDLAGLQTPHIEVVLQWTVSWCLSRISGRRGQTVKINFFQLGLQKKILLSLKMSACTDSNTVSYIGRDPILPSLQLIQMCIHFWDPKVLVLVRGNIWKTYVERT